MSCVWVGGCLDARTTTTTTSPNNKQQTNNSLEAVEHVGLLAGSLSSGNGSGGHVDLVLYRSCRCFCVALLNVVVLFSTSTHSQSHHTRSTHTLSHHTPHLLTSGNEYMAACVGTTLMFGRLLNASLTSCALLCKEANSAARSRSNNSKEGSPGLGGLHSTLTTT